ncbi:MAG: hypothetical protein AAGG00_01425 [Cyanobacteria bacterium P01_H01_bin.150]
MSQVRKRPTVEQVQLKIKQNTHSPLQSHVQTLSPTAQKICQQVIQTLPTEQPMMVDSTQIIRQKAQSLHQKVLSLAKQSNLSITETAQVAALVASEVYIKTNPQKIEQSFIQLKSCNSEKSARLALNNCMQKLELNHQKVIVDNLVIATNNAAVKIGFTPIVSSTTIVNDTVRMVASDEKGRSIVTELATNPDNPVQMATEIIGTSDASCEETLNAFEAALKEEGVIINAPPQRKFTGGICELEAAKSFARKHPTPIKKSGKQKQQPRNKASQKQMKQGF